ncbi:adenosylmethionine--8-amino-7-oxononanoate transaminase [Lichenicola cladoniae]|uniref:Adenosylmethionine-8-amino-7-oxononanoate aminotransferase n=1 Tax=Lichenicola cladoniae TaxID=1484109 RepID=A0A6M8HP84_9PROT|nr:adenosylmethionine--8-amino-7-oxononanoate transaminase [Lichenicola cladoniae]NPD66519.1 adenosylmethionine--8-amino-7-oxononanoate transaminase [Acetobacteraceae bacterium]QKE90263.1 adenosylmethionine--8-amino-7-oxononanoate transaminase [Lichenicola cladoniae]
MSSSNLWLPYTQMRTALPPLKADWTDGCRIGLADGRVLIDGIASWWTACHGYNHPHIADALRTQLARMPHVMFGGLVHEPAQRLADRLTTLLPGDLNSVFFAESGSVAVEVAIKMAIQYWLNRGEQGRSRLVAFRGGYHGDTFATMAVCDPEEGMHSLFRGVLAQHHLVDLPRDDASEAMLGGFLALNRDGIAAILVEPLVQGAGGMVFHAPEVLQRLRRLADQHGLLLILDEIFTGFGRTGSLFACEQAGIVPDIITLSKALTGGTMALSAAIARPHVFEAFQSDDPVHGPTRALMHGPTYMGNALACAAANASLDLFEREDRLGQVASISAQLESELEPCRALPGVVDVRVMGAIGVVQLARIEAMNALKAALVEQGVWVRPFRDIIYLTPAFTITSAELTVLTRAVRRAIATI